MIDLTIGADHRGMELKDQVSKWICPIDECMGDIVTFHDVGIGLITDSKNKNIKLRKKIEKLEVELKIANKSAE